MTTDGIIFDLDGTLVDTLGNIAALMNRTLTEFDQPTHPTESYRRFVGDGVRSLAERVLANDRQHLVEPLLAVYQPRLAAEGAKGVAPYPGIPALLSAINAADLPMAICSNKPQAGVEQVVATLLHDWHFDAIFGQRPDLPHKPDPTAPLTIARDLGWAPDKVLYFGDTDTDMQTAVNAGMVAIGCSWGFRDAEELKTHGAQIVIDRPIDAMPLFS